MSILLFKFTNQTVNDVVQLNAYLSSAIGTSFQYVNYLPGSNTVVVAALLGSYSFQSSLQSAITVALNNYTNPVSTSGPPGSIQTGSTVKLNSIAPYSGTTISSTANLDMVNNRIINLSAPLSVTDAANKAYVDSISPGTGLSKNLTGPVFNVNLDNTL